MDDLLKETFYRRLGTAERHCHDNIINENGRVSQKSLATDMIISSTFCEILEKPILLTQNLNQDIDNQYCRTIVGQKTSAEKTVGNEPRYKINECFQEECFQEIDEKTLHINNIRRDGRELSDIE